MKVYTLTMRIEVDDEDDPTPQDIRDAFYDAGGDLPFGFDITTIEKEG